MRFARIFSSLPAQSSDRSRFLSTTRSRAQRCVRSVESSSPQRLIRTTGQIRSLVRRRRPRYRSLKVIDYSLLPSEHQRGWRYLSWSSQGVHRLCSCRNRPLRATRSLKHGSLQLKLTRVRLLRSCTCGHERLSMECVRLLTACSPPSASAAA